MKRKRFLYLLGALLLACCLTAGPVQGEGGSRKPLSLFDFDLVLEPGGWQGLAIQDSSAACGGYMVEVTPLERSVEGAYVAKALVQPEYNADTDVWWDVVRVHIPATQPPLSANVRLYRTCPLPLVLDEDIALFCSPEQVDEWVSAIQLLSDDKNLRLSMQKAALAKAQTYSWKNRAKTSTEKIEKILK